MLTAWLAERLGLVHDIDSSNYLAMAEGRSAEVLRPFSNRILGPLLAQYVGFDVLQLVSIALFAVAVVWLLRRSGVSIVRIFPFLLAPWIVSFAYNLYMPDMLACAVTALMFVAYARVGTWAALPFLILMVLARESSVVVAGVWLMLLAGACWKRRALSVRVLLAEVGILLSVVVGMVIVRQVSAASPGDINGLGVLYMPIKAAVNGFVSVTGIRPWNDVYARELQGFYTHPPIWRMACPAVLRLGRFSEVGIYEWHPFQLLVTAKIMFLEFGVLAPYAILKGRALLTAISAPWQRLAFCSGLAYWLLTPICGFSPTRYVGYSWPLFWFAPLVLLQDESPRRRRLLLAAHFGSVLLARFV